MSRSGYSDDSDGDDQWRQIMYRGSVASATRGKRGQALLRELLAALDAMPKKRLVSNEFEAEGAFCTLGVIGAKRGIDIKQFDVESGDYDPAIGKAFDIADPLAREIMWENDECVSDELWSDREICGPVRPHYPDWGSHKRTFRVPNPRAEEKRWRYMRDWVARQIASSEGQQPGGAP